MKALSVETAEEEVQVKFPHGEAMSEARFFDFCQANPTLRIERNVEGTILVMSPTGADTGFRDSSLNAQLYLWSKKNGAGVSFSSSTGFQLPNGAVRSPDASWISMEKWNGLTADERKRFPPLCPDFVIELRSESDRLKLLQEKMTEYLENGAKLGFLIDPIERLVHVYRPGKAVETLAAVNPLCAEPEMPGLGFDMTDIW